MGSTRDVRYAWLTGAAGRLGHWHSDHIPHADKIAELRALSSDPDELAQAAGFFAARHGGHELYRADMAAEQLLRDAGADPEAVDRYAIQFRGPRRGLDLGRMAEGLTHLPKSHPAD